MSKALYGSKVYPFAIIEAIDMAGNEYEQEDIYDSNGNFLLPSGTTFETIMVGVGDMNIYDTPEDDYVIDEMTTRFGTDGQAMELTYEFNNIDIEVFVKNAPIIWPQLKHEY